VKEDIDMKRKNLHSGSAALVALGMAVLAAWLLSASNASADGCEPFCFKHPITGEIHCSPDCP
jgi:hypothetical protein